MKGIFVKGWFKIQRICSKIYYMTEYESNRIGMISSFKY